MELRDYQREVIQKIQNRDTKRCCVSLATGAGKTVIFSDLVTRLNGRILICVHREELVEQTSRTLTLGHECLTPKLKRVTKDIVVAMVQTLHSRMKKGEIDIHSFDHLIVDECHRGEFMKVLEGYQGSVIGFTATPNYEKKEIFFACLACGERQDSFALHCGRKMKKYKRLIPLSDYYHTLIDGIDIRGLIDKNFLVNDENFEIDVDTTRLVFDERKGEYTEESIGIVFGSDAAIANTVNTFQTLALGMKTIVFNPNSVVNRKLYHAMKAVGLNAKMYDSVNKGEDRKALVEWFKSTPDAILLNIQVFTTGFDCTDVEVIFLNKKTMSINLFLQMVGRGGRITDKIFKPTFRVIDMGNNNKEFGDWSQQRSWSEYFSANSVKAVGSPNPLAVRLCHNCEAMIAANSLKCQFCKTERDYNNAFGIIGGLPKRNGKPVIPSAKEIVDYCEKKGLICNDARNLVYKFIGQMFDEIPKEVYIKHRDSGALKGRLGRFINPYYFAIQKSNLKGNREVRLEGFLKKAINKIDVNYD